MFDTAATAGILGKAGLAWLTVKLKNWTDERKLSATDQRVWEEISTGILSHTQVLAERYAKVTTVAFPRETVDLSAIYVPLRLQLRGRGNKDVFVIDRFPDQLFQKHKRILILDVAGMGKSTLSRILFLRSLESRKYLPLLIDLRRLSDGLGIEQSLVHQLSIKQGHKEILSDFLRSQPLLFILDGFDEISDKNRVVVSRGVRDFVDRAPNASFVMTSRPEHSFSEYSDFSVFNINELRRSEAELLFKKYGAAYDIEDSSAALIAALSDDRHDESVGTFLKNPLLASLLFRAFEYKSVVPVRRGVFYRQVFDALYDAHDLSKETGYVREKKTGLHHDDLHRVLRAMASQFKLKNEVEVSVDDFKSMARVVSTTLCPDLEFSADDFMHDILHSVPIFIKDGTYVRWAHKSLLDYFLCEFLLRDYSQSKELALEKIAFDYNAMRSENFLVLVHEADPVLFAKSITLPAIENLISNHSRVDAAIGAHVSGAVREDLIAFLMCYDCAVLPSDGTLERSYFNDRAKLKAELGDGSADLSPRLICKFAMDFDLIYFARTSSIALNVPVLMGDIPAVGLDVVARRYENAVGILDSGYLSRRSGLLLDRSDAAAWERLTEDFSSIMQSTGPSSDFPLFNVIELKRVKEKLGQVVNSSFAARGEVF